MKLTLVANWKNHPSSLPEARRILAGLKKRRAFYKKIALYIAPPLPYFESVSTETGGFAKLAVQDMFFETKGTHTSFVTPDILKSFGVSLAILGHSERRALGETDANVSDKVRAAIRSGITPLVCVGERTHDPDGEHLSFVRDQIKASLSSIRKREDARKVMIAYEPVWAIGEKAKGAMSPSDLSQMVIFIRKVLNDLYGRDAAEKIRILYGGSVDQGNAEELMRATGIAGFLVGRASLDPKGFARIAGGTEEKGRKK